MALRQAENLDSSIPQEAVLPLGFSGYPFPNHRKHKTLHRAFLHRCQLLILEKAFG